MKRLLILLTGIAMLASCRQQPDYQVMTGPDGSQQVIYQDNGVSRVMEYALFMSLMNNGGYNRVHNYYVSNPAVSPVYVRSNYSSYSTPVTKSWGSTTNQTSKSVERVSNAQQTAPVVATPATPSKSWGSTTTRTSTSVQTAPVAQPSKSWGSSTNYTSASVQKAAPISKSWGSSTTRSSASEVRVQPSRSWGSTTTRTSTSTNSYSKPSSNWGSSSGSRTSSSGSRR